MKDYNFLQQKFVVNTYPNRGLVIERGDGVYLYDDKGTRYLDLMSNYGVNIFGYKYPAITETLTEQLKKITALHGSFSNPTRAEAAQMLIERCGRGLAQVYFSNSGAEANEAALKFAVLATGKKKFISTRNGYHGKTLGALSATDGEKYRKVFEPLLWHFTFIDYNDIGQLENAITEETAAFIVEPLQGDGGIRLADNEYLVKVKEVCRKKGVLLIIDEVQTGVGRTGTFLASHNDSLTYDIVTLGKGLAGGLPVGATLVSSEIGKAIPRLSHTSTFGGNPLVCAGISAVLQLLTDEVLTHVRHQGDYLREKLQQFSSPFIAGVRGKGLMVGIEMKEKRNEMLRLLQQKKVLTIPASDSVIRLLPPYIIEKQHIDESIEAFESALKTLV